MLLDRFRQRADAVVAGDADRGVDPEIRRLLGGRLERVTVEIVRPGPRESKVFTTMTLAGATIEDAAFARADFMIERKPGATKATRGHEWLLAFPREEKLDVECSVPGDPLSLGSAEASLAAIAPISMFAALARGRANLVAWGVGWDVSLGLIGLVKIHRDLDRREVDEAALREAGFRETGDEGRWTIPRTKTSLVWMGGTVYGYVGDVPLDSVGSWPGGDIS